MRPFSRKSGNYSSLRLFGLAFTALMFGTSASNALALTLDEAKWNANNQTLAVKGSGTRGDRVFVQNANNHDQVLGSTVLRSENWAIRSNDPVPVPCAVSVLTSEGDSAGPLDVANRPADCGPITPPTTTTTSTPPTTSTSTPPTTTTSTPPTTSTSTPPTTTTSTTPTTTTSTPATTTTTTLPGELPDVSINSTSQNGTPGLPVTEQPFTGLSGYRVFSANDLGMHCGDFDTRISSVLPPFNLVHTQVIQRGAEPRILGPADGIEVVYSAASNPSDPILTGINGDPLRPVLSSQLSDGSVYKTNFWDVARAAYDPFYPSGILPAFYPAGADILDLGLPMPNVEQLFLGDGDLTAIQQEMPGRYGPYTLNDPMAFKLFTVDQPFFTGFPFGYTAEGVNWFEAAGISLTAFDDFGRENPWQLMRVQARSGGQVLASLDTVLPISGEANCGFCHNDPADGGNGAATDSLTTVALSIDDTANVPMEVSLEWAADINILRLHDQKHGTQLIVGTSQDDPPGTMPFKAVVCQTCHYTPALDLAQLGPLGPENDSALELNGQHISDSLANGRDQVKNKSMSNVMHSHHATVEDLEGNPLFPAMPPAVDSNGNLRNPLTGRQVLEATCYQCHPGRRTDCLRGAMASGGMLCQDCHGDMAQVGDDFSRNVAASPPEAVGAFELAGDFYTNPGTPRVPWANEPGCGSCHTGDAVDNMHGTPGTIGDPEDGIRLMQAYRTTDTKATPIVPTNKRFAENVVATGDAAGNPMLYRVSKGHEGVFCEACHGSTHGIWPNKNPFANDNVTATQLQGHTGTITECSTCHGNADMGLSLGGPHGMHQVSQISANGTSIDRGATITSWNRNHEELHDYSSCRNCHGVNGEGTVLSRTAANRTLMCKEDSAPGCTKVIINGQEARRVFVAKGTEISCVLCHDNKINSGGDD